MKKTPKMRQFVPLAVKIFKPFHSKMKTTSLAYTLCCTFCFAAVCPLGFNSISDFRMYIWLEGGRAYNHYSKFLESRKCAIYQEEFHIFLVFVSDASPKLSCALNCSFTSILVSFMTAFLKFSTEHLFVSTFNVNSVSTSPVESWKPEYPFG